MSSTPPQPIVPSLPASTPLQNRSPVKSVGSQSSFTAESFRPGTSDGRHAAEAIASSSKGKEKQKRLSQVVPRRPKGKELVKEGEPWEAKNILSFGKDSNI